MTNHRFSRPFSISTLSPLCRSWGRLLGLALLATPFAGQLTAQADWLKSKAKAKAEWNRHAVDFSSNDAAIADNIKQNNEKFAHGYQFAQSTWVPGREG